MDRDWISEDVVAKVLDALGDEEMRLPEIAARVEGVRAELVARRIGAMAGDGSLTRREVEGRDVYARTAG